MKNKLIISALILMLSAALIGGFTMAWFTDSASSEPVTFFAGTVLIEAESSVINSQYFNPAEAVYVYGVEEVTGHLYEIDVLSGDANLIYETDLDELAPTDRYSPNGLAFDNANRRLYFSIVKNKNTKLYFYDFKEKELVESGQINGAVIYNATYGGGYYWYIKNGSDDLYKASFDADGKNPSAQLVEAKIAGGKNWGFGDIELDYVNGVIFGSATGNNFFKYDLSTGLYTPVASWDHMQLAYGSNGKLYGHKTSNGKWYEIDVNAPSITGLDIPQNIKYNDLATGYISVWNPGDRDKVKYQVQNKGSKKSYVRASLSGYWLEYDEDNDVWIDWTPPAEVVTITTCDDTPWEQNPDGKIYYQGILGLGETVELCVEVYLDGPSTTNEFQGKRFVVTAEFDAIQATNGASEALDWNLDL